LIVQLGAYPISPLFDPHDSLRTRDTEYHISMPVALAAGANAAAWSTARSQLFQLHADAFGTVEQPSQVKAGQGIVGMKPDNCGESRHGVSVTGLELCKRSSIVGRRRSPERCRRQRLIGAQRFATPSQDQVADRTPMFGKGAADKAAV
jgi:hypothetical protein